VRAAGRRWLITDALQPLAPTAVKRALTQRRRGPLNIDAPGAHSGRNRSANPHRIRTRQSGHSTNPRYSKSLRYALRVSVYLSNKESLQAPYGSQASSAFKKRVSVRPTHYIHMICVHMHILALLVRRRHRRFPQGEDYTSTTQEGSLSKDQLISSQSTRQ
jgi:hypothetical protein